MSESNGNGHQPRRRRRRGRPKVRQANLALVREVASVAHVAKTRQEAQALALRLKGKGYREIAEAMGVEYEEAVSTVQGMLTRDWEVDAEKLNEMRQLEIGRIDRLWEVYFPRATNEEQPNMAAANMCLKLLKRRAELLGLDREIKGAGPIQVNIGTDAIRQMAEAAQDPMTLDALERVAAFWAHGEEAVDAEAEEVDALTEEPE